MKAVRIYSVKRRGKEQWFVSHGKEVLSGPWPTNKDAWEAKQEWVVVKK